MGPALAAPPSTPSTILTSTPPESTMSRAKTRSCSEREFRRVSRCGERNRRNWSWGLLPVRSRDSESIRTRGGSKQSALAPLSSCLVRISRTQQRPCPQRSSASATSLPCQLPCAETPRAAPRAPSRRANCSLRPLVRWSTCWPVGA
jgi:hypothetical protein